MENHTGKNQLNHLVEPQLCGLCGQEMAEWQCVEGDREYALGKNCAKKLGEKVDGDLSALYQVVSMCEVTGFCPLHVTVSHGVLLDVSAPEEG